MVVCQGLSRPCPYGTKPRFDGIFFLRNPGRRARRHGHACAAAHEAQGHSFPRSRHTTTKRKTHTPMASKTRRIAPIMFPPRRFNCTGRRCRLSSLAVTVRGLPSIPRRRKISAHLGLSPPVRLDIQDPRANPARPQLRRALHLLERPILRNNPRWHFGEPPET